MIQEQPKIAIKVRELLRETDIPFERIALDLGFPVSFLMQFKLPGYRNDPAAGRMERLYEYLTGKTLEY